jgi:chromosome segregation ATPase
LEISLITPNSGLSAKDALKVLNRLNATDSITMMERMISMKHTIERDISDLEVIENEYFEKLADQAETAEKLRFTQVALKQAARDAKQAVQDEILARRALEEAQKRLATTKLNVNDLSKSFSKIQFVEAKVNSEVEAVAEFMSKRQETIRKALRKKKREIEAERGKQIDKTKGAQNDVDDADNPELIVAIETFREQESVLQKENNRIEEMVARLISRAEKLKKRAEQLENVKVQD